MTTKNKARKNPVPDETRYVSLRAQHPWLLRQLNGVVLHPSAVAEFICDLARVFAKDPPAIIRKDGGKSHGMAWCGNGEGLLELSSGLEGGDGARRGVSVGLIVHEYAHILQHQWWRRMQRYGKLPKWQAHGPAFIDQLDRVAVEAAKLLR